MIYRVSSPPMRHSRAKKTYQLNAKRSYKLKLKTLNKSVQDTIADQGKLKAILNYVCPITKNVG